MPLLAFQSDDLVLDAGKEESVGSRA